MTGAASSGRRVEQDHRVHAHRTTPTTRSGRFRAGQATPEAVLCAEEHLFRTKGHQALINDARSSSFKRAVAPGRIQLPPGNWP